MKNGESYFIAKPMFMLSIITGFLVIPIIGLLFSIALIFRGNLNDILIGILIIILSVGALLLYKKLLRFAQKM